MLVSCLNLCSLVQLFGKSTVKCAIFHSVFSLHFQNSYRFAKFCVLAIE